MKNRPLFHITGEKGWINDPNGVVKFKGKYHVFYQYHPYSCEWGPMHWGHVVSDDLLNWTYLPNALTPGDEFDKDGCFSGTSLVKDNILYVVYTGFINHSDPKLIKQIQCLAYSEDGINFKKCGVIIDGKDIPDGYQKCDFRDPKLFFKDNAYYLLVAAKKESGGGDILLYKSSDLRKWEFVNSVLTHDSEGKMIECVDYHEDLNLLVYSEQDFPAHNNHCLNIHSCEYEIGQFDKKFKFIPKNAKALIDYGFDFYAPQIMSSDHYLIAWLNMWGRNNPSSKYGFAGMLTVPRKVTIENGRMMQKPVIYGKLTESVDIKSHYENKMLTGTLEIKIEDLKNLEISLRKGEGEKSKFYLKDDEFYFDRSNSGERISGKETDELSLSGIRKMPFIKQKETLIYIVLDKYSIEIFVNGISMSNVIYPKESSDLFEINVESKKASLNIYK